MTSMPFRRKLAGWATILVLGYLTFYLVMSIPAVQDGVGELVARVLVPFQTMP